MAAPVGNKYAVGNNGGRPPIYDNAELLQQECDNYFEYIKGLWHEEMQTVTVNGEQVMQKVQIWDRKPEPAAITGLALYLGFSGRKTLDDYADKEEFGYIIKRAKSRVELHYEHSLNYQGATGAIFALKNMGWKDKIETEHSGSMGIVWNEQKTYDSQQETNPGT